MENEITYLVFDLFKEPKSKYGYLSKIVDKFKFKKSTYESNDNGDRSLDLNIRNSELMIDPPKIYLSSQDILVINNGIKFIIHLMYPKMFSDEDPLLLEPEILRYKPGGVFLEHIDRIRKGPQNYLQTGSLLIVGCFPCTNGGNLCSQGRILLNGFNNTNKIIWKVCFLTKDVIHNLEPLISGSRIVYKTTVFQSLR